MSFLGQAVPHTHQCILNAIGIVIIVCHAATGIRGVIVCRATTAIGIVILCQATTAICVAIFVRTAMAISCVIDYHAAMVKGAVVFGLAATAICIIVTCKPRDLVAGIVSSFSKRWWQGI